MPYNIMLYVNTVELINVLPCNRVALIGDLPHNLTSLRIFPLRAYFKVLGKNNVFSRFATKSTIYKHFAAKSTVY